MLHLSANYTKDYSYQLLLSGDTDFRIKFKIIN